MKGLYYVIHGTGGIIGSLIGGIMFICCKIGKCKSYKYRNAVCVEVGTGWGGLEMGMFFFIGKDCQGCSPHEYGHTIQMLGGGPLYLIVIGIPSAIRYGYREIVYKVNKQKYYKLPDYDAIWFEGQASSLGRLANTNHWKWL